jgi:hypothetical protein
MVQMNDNIVGLDASILMCIPRGHLACYDPLIDNKDSKEDIADVLIEML